MLRRMSGYVHPETVPGGLLDSVATTGSDGTATFPRLNLLLGFAGAYTLEVGHSLAAQALTQKFVSASVIMSSQVTEIASALIRPFPIPVGSTLSASAYAKVTADPNTTTLCTRPLVGAILSLQFPKEQLRQPGLQLVNARTIDGSVLASGATTTGVCASSSVSGKYVVLAFQWSKYVLQASSEASIIPAVYVGGIVWPLFGLSTREVLPSTYLSSSPITSTVISVVATYPTVLVTELADVSIAVVVRDRNGVGVAGQYVATLVVASGEDAEVTGNPKSLLTSFQGPTDANGQYTVITRFSSQGASGAYDVIVSCNGDDRHRPQCTWHRPWRESMCRAVDLRTMVSRCTLGKCGRPTCRPFAQFVPMVPRF